MFFAFCHFFSSFLSFGVNARPFAPHDLWTRAYRFHRMGMTSANSIGFHTAIVPIVWTSWRITSNAGSDISQTKQWVAKRKVSVLAMACVWGWWARHGPMTTCFHVYYANIIQFSFVFIFSFRFRQTDLSIDIVSGMGNVSAGNWSRFGYGEWHCKDDVSSGNVFHILILFLLQTTRAAATRLRGMRHRRPSISRR